MKPFACIYVVIFAMLFSGALNNYLINSLEASLRWVYLLVICIVSTQALKNSTNKQFLDALTLAIFCPICFQLLSIFLGYSKSGEADGSASWIGGYNHESGFSLIALTLIFVAALRVVCRLRFGWSLILIGVISLLASNYRTTMIAGIPVIFTVFIAYGDLKLKGQDKLLLPGLAVAGIAVLIALASQFQDRFSDLGKTVELFPKLIAPPDAYTREAQQLLSARFYIWSKYLTAFFEGGFAQQFVGFGPDSWKQTFPKYAHNTFVSALYEIGYIGCTLIIWALWSLARLSLHGTSKPLRSVLLAAHLGFFIVNFATMPLWNIEGIIYYGILVGFTYYSKIAPRPEKYS
ncbi:MAG: hypothetical protein CMK07_11275 [Ponticaulis sp.]|nr:hypothetical protein [Ponticaulis sp.]